ncbi:hypothetical protein HPB48_005260 [Haemaphysalis longicornis]|uniref:cyclin-dependent kinase n=1 Tax=Haemaphysalis longicornis TaxID=44386 RepID=A0A9J6FP10_HAELO|nr:hypothetical protein HPB48_005260 [Haemaphysalis longicornis]
MEDRFDAKVHNIGDSPNGIVYRARGDDTARYVGLGEMRFENETEGVPSTAMRETSPLKERWHPNGARLLDALRNDREPPLVLEYGTEDLQKQMDTATSGRTPPAVNLEKCSVWQLLHGIAYVRSRGIVHRDLKPQNRLVDGKGVTRLPLRPGARPGHTTAPVYTHEGTTPWCRAPEILLSAHYYTTLVDVWRISCIFAEMFMLRVRYAGDPETDLTIRIFRTIGTPDETT